jgi:hypothetical protein
LEITRRNLGFVKFGRNKNSEDELFLFRFFDGQKNEKFTFKKAILKYILMLVWFVESLRKLELIKMK